MWEDIQALMERFSNFDDGLLKSFSYSFDGSIPLNPLRAKITLFARDWLSAENVWGTVEIEVDDVMELSCKAKGMQDNGISLGVKLMRFDEIWCIDIDGNYVMAGYPKSMDEVRQFGECYVTGRSVKGRVIE